MPGTFISKMPHPHSKLVTVQFTQPKLEKIVQNPPAMQSQASKPPSGNAFGSGPAGVACCVSWGFGSEKFPFSRLSTADFSASRSLDPSWDMEVRELISAFESIMTCEGVEVVDGERRK